MRTLRRRLAVLLTGVLVLATGPCPATVLASVVRVSGGGEEAAAPCCCRAASDADAPAGPAREGEAPPAPDRPGHCPYCDVMGGRPVITDGEAAPTLPAPVSAVAVSVAPHAMPGAPWPAVEEDGHAPPGAATALVGTVQLIV